MPNPDTTRQVEFNSPYGRVIWTLSQDVTDTLALVPPDVRMKVFEGLGSNITILCGATLKAFDNPGVVETLNLVMQEVREIITNEQTTDADSKLKYCANCGARHTEAAIAFAKAIGASTALCKKCTVIEKMRRGIIDES